MLLLALWACVPRAPVGEMTADVREPPRYDVTVRDATRELKLYDEFVTVLILRATYLDAATRRAMEDMRAHLLLLEPEVLDQRRADARAQADATHEVWFSAAADESAGLGFGAGEDKLWRVRGFVDEKACAALDVGQRTPTPLDRRLLPHLTDWDQLWVARFDKGCGARGRFELQVTGARGAGEVAWEVGG